MDSQEEKIAQLEVRLKKETQRADNIDRENCCLRGEIKGLESALETVVRIQITESL